VAAAAGVMLRRAPASATAIAASASVAPPPPVEIRRPCLAGEPGGTACEGREIVAWCDAGGRPVGCCGKGLVPAGADGICACAPGGTSVPEAQRRGCPGPRADAAAAFSRARDSAGHRAIDCFVPLVDAGGVSGAVFAASFFLTAQGEVYGARVNRSTVPNEAAQACAIAALRATRFPPPRGEDVGSPQGFGFEFEK